MKLSKESDVSAADWLSQTRAKSYRNFSRVETWLFSADEIPNVSAADWLSQTRAKSYRNFSRVEMWLFSVVEIPIKRSSLRGK